MIRLQSRSGWRIAVATAPVLFPVSLWADVGTPLLWAQTFHLWIGNTLVGLVEAWLLARAFKLPGRPPFLTMVLANYFSAWVGFIWSRSIFDRHGADIYTGLQITWLLVGLTYALTLILEWPFVAWCFRGNRPWFVRSVKGTLLAQTASYAVLFSGYFALSGNSLYRGMTLVSPGEMKAPSGVSLFLISTNDGRIYRKDLPDNPAVKIGEAKSRDIADYLLLKPSATDTNRFDLYLARGRHWDEKIPLVANISTTLAQTPENELRSMQYYGWGTAMQIGSATNSSLTLRWAHWPDMGVWSRDDERHVVFRMAFGTPFGGLSPYRVIHLPGDQALVQLENQICLVDIPGRKIARLTNGWGILALEREDLRRD